MSNTIYDVFISYRRNGGFETAKHLNDLLVRDGYSVSFDIDTLREGDFDKALLNRIEQSVDFILVVDEHAFDKTLDPSFDSKKDWLRIELAYALKLKKNIIPILMSGVNGFPDNLPEDIEGVITKHGPEYSKTYFNTFYDKLKGFMHALPRNLNLGNTQTLKVSSPYLKIKSDLDCLFYLDGEERAQIKANIIYKTPLEQGEYELKFVSLDNAKDIVEMEFVMPTVDKLQKVNLCAVRDNHLEKEKNNAEERGEFSVNGITFKMIYVEGGTFMMGANEEDTDAYDGERPTHQVTLSSYFIGETVVTQALWETVMGENKNLSRFKGANRPVEMVSWDDCQEFIRKLNEKTKRNFRLPTEAEWEFAARGGNKSEGYKYAGSNNIKDVAWYNGNSKGETHPVAKYHPNELGLYDMSGNVWEWCLDWYGAYDNNSQTNPKGPKDGEDHVLRGGGWNNDSRNCRSLCRVSNTPSLKIYDLGLRLAL
jgi:formylglycine-generating enzyme required for sulfatase activity